MKIVATIFLLMLHISLFAQEIRSGTYITAKKDIGFESEIFQLYDDNTFDYVLSSCEGRGFGHGTYHINETDSLVLEFENCDSCVDVVDVSIREGQEDSLKVQLTVKDYSSDEGLPGVACFVRGSRTGWVTGYDGNGDRKLAKVDSTRTLVIQFVGYNNVEIPISAHASEITGTIKLTNNWFYKHNDIKKFKVQKINKSGFKLMRSPTVTTSYVRIPEAKTIEVLKERLGQSDYEFFDRNFMKK